MPNLLFTSRQMNRQQTCAAAFSLALLCFECWSRIHFIPGMASWHHVECFSPTTYLIAALLPVLGV